MARDATSAPHIVVIDDEDAIRDLICQILADEGYRVSSSDTYLDDLDQLLRLEPDLIVLDILLRGERSGLDFLDQVKTDPRTTRIPIAVCTGASHLDQHINARLTEWDCRPIFKPFDLDALLAEIDRCLRAHDP
ncbi:MAG: two-component system, OmpR family, response regulator [Thermomicrobiales bacterium]|jgi:DNA-binding response OmpR family regulator|nr:two-component system, OmpR family, response regulator [Thermomicrobiales bacterium]